MKIYNTIIVEKNEGIGILTLNRPEVFNAISQELIDEIRDALSDIDKDEEIKVLIITGAGKGFQAGADIKELSEIALIANLLPATILSPSIADITPILT